MNNHPPCFLLVDDHALFRTGLVMMLQQGWPHARVCQAANWQEAQQELALEQPCLILLDVHLPDMHGLAALTEARTRWPQCPVLVMSAEVDAAVVKQAREAGALGFLPKSATPAEVLGAVTSALAGEPAFGAVPYAALQAGAMGGWQGVHAPASSQVMKVRDPGAPLSDEQRRILHYLGRGTPNKAIARQMGMSESAVRAEVSWLTESLGATSREQAFAEAVARGLIAP
jgi:two-component system, NarL family, nitrate/nitrite response regulator NarL